MVVIHLCYFQSFFDIALPHMHPNNLRHLLTHHLHHRQALIVVCFLVIITDFLLQVFAYFFIRPHNMDTALTPMVSTRHHYQMSGAFSFNISPCC